MMFPRAMLLLAVLAGCSPGENACDELETQVSPDQPTSVGSTAEQAAASVVGTRTSTLASHDAATTGLTIEVNWSGEDGTWVRRSPNADVPLIDGAESTPVCVDALLLPVTMVFRTDDGRFDETWQVELEVDESSPPHFAHAVDPDRLVGTWRPSVAGYADMSLEIEGTISPDSTSGVLRVRAISADGEPDQLWDIALWPAG